MRYDDSLLVAVWSPLRHLCARRGRCAVDAASRAARRRRDFAVSVALQSRWSFGRAARADRVARTTEAAADLDASTRCRGADDARLPRHRTRSSATRAWAMSAGPAEQGQAQIFRHRRRRRTGPTVRDDATRACSSTRLAFWDNDHGIAMSDPVDGQLFILATDDGGTTWTRVCRPTTRRPCFPAKRRSRRAERASPFRARRTSGSAPAAARRARVFRSTDRGRTWTVADTPVHAGNAASGIFSVAFSDAQHGVVVGGDYTKPKGCSTTSRSRTTADELAPAARAAAGGLHVRRRVRARHGGPLARRRRPRRHRDARTTAARVGRWSTPSRTTASRSRRATPAGQPVRGAASRKWTPTSRRQAVDR